jgi:hypothetical protein
MVAAEAVEWARSGAMALTGRADGPGLRSAGSPASTVQRWLEALGPGMPDVRILGERAAIAGWTRRAPWSAGGAFRILPTRDGWFGVSLARSSDVELLPALVEGMVNDPWPDLGRWLADRTSAEALERTAILGLPAAPVPSAPPAPRRPGVVAVVGGARDLSDRPLVVDLSSLWAGPLCAHLLGLAGARVIKVESPARPDGARQGPRAFFDLLHAGHESAALDLQDRLLPALLSAADVVIEASRPRALRQAGLHAEEYVARGTIWVSITAYGRDAENAMRVGFGDDVAAGAGLVAWEDGVPCPAGDALADPLSGVAAAAAATAALRQPSGALLDVSMHDLAAAARQEPAPGASPAGDHTTAAHPNARLSSSSAPALGTHTRNLRTEFERWRLSGPGARR